MTTLTQADCDYITSPILQQCLPRMGIVRSFPRTLVHSHSQYQGLEIPNLFWLQGYYHIERLIKFFGSSHLSGSLLRHSLESLRLELRCNRSVLELRYFWRFSDSVLGGKHLVLFSHASFAPGPCSSGICASTGKRWVNHSSLCISGVSWKCAVPTQSVSDIFEICNPKRHLLRLW